MITKRYLFLIFTLICINTFSQTPNNDKNRNENSSKIGVIKGKVIEKGTNTPMEYANIIVYKNKDSTMITGTISNINGEFEITELPFGKYFVTADFIGYNKKTIYDIKISPKLEYEIILGTIKLSPSFIGINEVEVIGDRPMIEYKIDKKVVSVSQDISSTGGTAIDVLENVPSIQTDIEGNISLRGSSNFTVYIDGRPSIIGGSDALQQIPATLIENIEIITNPSAKYTAEGTAGIINVKMKKRRGQGVNGIINTSIGTNDKYNSDVLLNYRAEKYNLYGAINYSRTNYNSKYDETEYNWDKKHFDSTKTEIIGLNSVVRDKEMTGMRGRQGIKVGLDYYINDNSTISFSGGYNKRYQERIGESKRTESFYNNAFNIDTIEIHELFDFDLTKDSIKIYNVMDSNIFVGGDEYEINLDYVKKFNDNGHEFSTSLYYEMEHGSRNQNLLELDSIKSDTTYLKITNNNPEYVIQYKADYIKPFNKIKKIETGIQFDREFSKYYYKHKGQDTTSEFMTIERNIYSAYAMFANHLFAGINYQLGLRLEYTDRDVTIDTSYIFNKLSLFPSIHLSKEINERNQLMVNYSRRLQRPREFSLSPLIRYYDTKTLRQGDPNLKPEFNQVFELNYQYSVKRSFVAMELYHKRSTNIFERRSYERLPDGKKLIKSKNTGNSYATGFELMANLTLKKLMVINASYTLYNYHLESDVINDNVDDEDLAWYAKFNTSVNTPWNGRLQVITYYRSPSITAQGTRDGFFVFNAGYRQDFFDRKLTATLQARDIFQSMNFNRVSYLDDAVIYSEYKRESPIVTLSLSYKINNYKSEKKERSMGNGGDDGGDF